MAWHWKPQKYSVFSLTWSAFMQIYWNKRKRLHKKRVQLPQDWFGDTNMAAVLLFWDTNMAAMTSCENTQSEKTVYCTTHTHILCKVSSFYWNPFIFVGYRSDRIFPVQILMFRMLRNNADARRCSNFELGLPVVTRSYWCSKTMNRRPCWCSKPVLRELNSFLM